MATAEDLEHAIGCLSVAFPQFVAKEISHLMDQIVASAQTIADPTEAMAALNVQSIVDGAAQLSEGSIWENLTSASVGIAASFVLRESDDFMTTLTKVHPSVVKRSQQVANLSGKVATTGMLFLSLFADVPYAAAQRLCETLVGLLDAKRENLDCLGKHIRQLTNCMAVVIENFTTHKESVFTDLDQVSVKLTEVETELLKSRRLFKGAVVFDASAFERARLALEVVDRILTPDKGDISILDVGSILALGSMGAAERSTANAKLCHVVIPQLVSMVEVEVSAVAAQTDVINYYLQALGTILQEYRSSATSARTKEMRDRAVKELLTRIQDLHARVDAARKSQSLRTASFEMMLWASRVKSSLSLMYQVESTSLQEGSPDGADQAALLEAKFSELLASIQAVNNTTTVAGVEDVTLLRTKVSGLAKGATRLLDQISEGRIQQDDLRTFHAQASTLALAQSSVLEGSSSACLQVKNACLVYMDVKIGSREKYENLLASMNQIGLDRASDLLSTGKFSEFMSADLDKLSYLGSMISCLTDTINGTDDVRTQQQLSKIRATLVGQQTNQYVAAADSADSGRKRVIERLQDRIASIQKNAKAVESIAEGVKKVAERAGVTLSLTTSAVTMFASNLDHLAVGAGGRLAADLEDFAKHPKTGVPLC